MIPTHYLFHLQANGETELLERVHFAIPSFHVYCHIPACQVCVFMLLVTESNQLGMSWRDVFLHLGNVQSPPNVKDLGYLMVRWWNAYGPIWEDFPEWQRDAPCSLCGYPCSCITVLCFHELVEASIQYQKQYTTLNCWSELCITVSSDILCLLCFFHRCTKSRAADIY